MLELKQPRQLMLTGLSFGVVADLLFFNQSMGVSVPLFILFGTAALITTVSKSRLSLTPAAKFLLAPLFLFGLMAMVRANPLLTAINLMMIFLLVLLLAIYATNLGMIESGLVGYLFRPLRSMIIIGLKPAPFLYREIDLDALSGSRRIAMPVLRGAILGAPILIVFTILLVSADVIFAQALFNLLSLEFSFGLDILVRRLSIIMIISWIGLGWLQYAIRSSVPGIQPTVPERAVSLISKQKPLGLIETMTIMGMIGTLFGAFVLLQFAYLFGGSDFIALGDISYAAYARRGFFELLTVAILTLLVLQVLNHLYNRDHPRATFQFNLLASLIIGFVLVMLVSAFNRLALYEWRFGFTELRLYTHVFMIWMGLALLWYLFTLWTNPTRFAIGALIALFGFVGTLNVINPERVIVTQNIKRFELMGHLDLNYLTTLSSDAVPSLIELNQIIQDSGAIKSDTECRALSYLAESSLNDLSSGSRDAAREYDCIETVSPDLLQTNLSNRQTYLETISTTWQAFHLSHWRAERVLKSKFEE